MKETIPAQVHYIYCTKFKKEMSVAKEFEKCQYEESDEYKIKLLISEYCNNEKNQIIIFNLQDLINQIINRMKPANVMKSKILYQEYSQKIKNILNESDLPIAQGNLILCNSEFAIPETIDIIKIGE
jgi:hypothetical protein